MPESLDVLIQKAEAGRVAAIKSGSAKLPQLPRHQPPPPDEPPLVGVPVKSGVAQSGMRGKQLQAMQRDERYRRFAREFFFSGYDGPTAMRASGYKGKSHSQLSNLLKQAVVQDELNRLGKVARAAEEASAVDVMALWREVAEANIFTFLDQDAEGTISLKPGIHDLPIGVQRTVKKVRVKKETRYESNADGDMSPVVTVHTDIELWDRLTAIRNIGEIDGVYNEAKADVLRDFAALLTDRIQGYQKRVSSRTFDATGRQIS